MHQWEYCRLVVWEVKQHKEKGYSCNTYISYSDSTGVKGYKLTEVDKQVLSYPPFDRVIGLLGATGWELVSIQFGLVNAFNGGAVTGLRVNSSDAIAILKRSVESGRAVDEPPIDI